MKLMTSATGPYKPIILEATPKQKKKISPSARNEINIFCSEFGPIITTYFCDNTATRRKQGPDQKPDHFYVAFENQSSVTDIDTLWAKQGVFDSWKSSWDIKFRIKSCPKALIDQIKLAAAGASGSLRNDQRAGKSRPIQANATDEHNTTTLASLKRNRVVQDEGDDLSPEPNKRPKNTIDRGETYDAAMRTLDKETIDRLRFEIVWLQNQHQETWRERDVARSECERYRAERDEARTKCEEYQEERDRAIERGGACAETCQQLRQQVDQLKKTLDDRNEGLRTVIAAARASLEAGLEPGQLGPSPESPQLLYS